LGIGVAKPQGVWERESPSGVQGLSPGRESEDKVPRKLNILKYNYKQILRIFSSISHIFTYAYVFLLAGTIPQSLRNGGNLIPFVPLVCK